MGEFISNARWAYDNATFPRRAGPAEADDQTP